MEIFLLLADELDDAVISLRRLWPQIFSFVLASMLFAATVLVIMAWPLWILGTGVMVALVRTLSGLRPLPGLRTDP